MTLKQLPLSEAALRLGIDYQQCRRLVLTGKLAGGRDDFGRLYVNARAVERWLRLTRVSGNVASATRRRTGD